MDRNAIWIAAGEALPVLALMNESSCSKLLLWSEKQQAVGLFSAADFNIVDGSLPPQWEASVNAGGHMEFSPKEWKRSDSGRPTTTPTLRQRGCFAPLRMRSLPCPSGGPRGLKPVVSYNPTYRPPEAHWR